MYHVSCLTEIGFQKNKIAHLFLSIHSDQKKFSKQGVLQAIIILPSYPSYCVYDIGLIGKSLGYMQIFLMKHMQTINQIGMIIKMLMGKKKTMKQLKDHVRQISWEEQDQNDYETCDAELKIPSDNDNSQQKATFCF